MTLNQRLADLTRYMRDQHLAFAERLSAADRDAVGAPDNWSAKDTLIHSMVWCQRHQADLETLERGDTPPEHDYGDYEAANREIFEAHKARSWDDAHAMIRETYARVDAFLDRVDEASLRAVPEGREEPLWRGIAGHAIYHPMIHMWQYLLDHGYDDVVTTIFGDAFKAQLLAVDDSAAWQAVAYYDLACIDALTGHTAAAIDKLGRALRLNPDLTEWSKQDEDLAALRDEPGYQALYN